MLHTLLFKLLEDKVAVCPLHKLLPDVVMLGVFGNGKTVTLKFAELTLQVPTPETTE